MPDFREIERDRCVSGYCGWIKGQPGCGGSEVATTFGDELREAALGGGSAL
jgi:hypothetical protein